MGQQAESTMLRPGSRSLLGTLSLALLVVTLAQPPREPSQSAQHNTVGGDLEEIMEGEKKLQHLLASPAQHTPACRQCFKGALGHLPQSSAATSTMDLSRLLSPQGPRGDAHLGKELKESWGTSRGVSVEDLLTELKKTRAELERAKSTGSSCNGTKQERHNSAAELQELQDKLKGGLIKPQKNHDSDAVRAQKNQAKVASLQQQLKKANRALSDTKERAKKSQDELLSLKKQLQDAKAALKATHTPLKALDQSQQLGLQPGMTTGTSPPGEKPGFSTGLLPDGKKSPFRDWPSYRKCTAQDARRSKYSGEWCGFMRNTKLLKTYPELNFCPKNTTDRSVYK